jgi:hypothetical protein
MATVQIFEVISEKFNDENVCRLISKFFAKSYDDDDNDDDDNNSNSNNNNNLSHICSYK